MALSELGLRSVGSNFTDRSIASLSAGQAAGTTAILAANADRTALMIVPPIDCILTIGSGLTTGRTLFGGVPNNISGSDCPTNQLFIRGLASSAAISLWEA